MAVRDKALGQDLDRGLTKLKAVVEEAR